MHHTKERIVELLAEAHANELALISVLSSHLEMAQDPSYRSLLEQHLDETRSHADRVDRRLKELGHRRSAASVAYELAQNVAKQALVLAKAPIDALRGGTDAEEKMLRNAMDEAMTEGLEIAAYDVIESVARGLGDHQTAGLAGEIRLDEERMFDALRKQIPTLAERVVRTTGDGHVPEPWPGYDAMSAEQVLQRLSDASPEEALTVVEYERGHKDRRTVIETAQRRAGA